MDPEINFDEPVGKTVGRRTKAPSGLSVATNQQQHAQAWREALGGVFIPKGVYRFHSHEEADEWLWKMITRPEKD